jgi:NitT/TauT family transport system substrate-binding protein
MPAALEAGNVDAALVVEPFLSVTKGAGARVLAAPYAEPFENLTVATYFTSEQFIQENPDVVDAFQEAIAKSLEYANENPDEVRRIITTYTQITEEVAAEMALPAFPAEIDVDSVEAVAELMQKYGVTEETVDVEALFATD